jgi:hypothetical protein
MNKTHHSTAATKLIIQQMNKTHHPTDEQNSSCIKTKTFYPSAEQNISLNR